MLRSRRRRAASASRGLEGPRRVVVARLPASGLRDGIVATCEARGGGTGLRRGLTHRVCACGDSRVSIALRALRAATVRRESMPAGLLRRFGALFYDALLLAALWMV